MRTGSKLLADEVAVRVTKRVTVRVPSMLSQIGRGPPRNADLPENTTTRKLPRFIVLALVGLIGGAAVSGVLGPIHCDPPPPSHILRDTMDWFARLKALFNLEEGNKDNHQS